MQKESQLFPKGLPPRTEWAEASVPLLEGSSNFACVTETKRADLLKEEALGGASPQGIQGLGFPAAKSGYSRPPARIFPHLQPQRSLIEPDDPNCALPPPLQTVSLQELQQDFENGSPTDPNNNQTPANGASVSYITFSPDDSTAARCEPPASAKPSDMLASVPPFVTFHTLILDMSGVSFVDLMGIKALAKVREPQGGGSPSPTPPRLPHPYPPTLPFPGAFISKD